MATIKDIAKMAGVSTSTVSHVVNKTRFVSPELVERVEKAIQTLEHPPNFVIRKNKALAIPSTGQTQYILFLTSDALSSFQRQVLLETQKLLTDTPYALLPIEYGSDSRRLDIISRYIQDDRAIVGLLVFPDKAGQIRELLQQTGPLPTVFLGRQPDADGADIPDAPVVMSDSYNGGYMAARHFIKNGHEQIAYIGSRAERTPRRLEGFLAAMKDFNISVNEDYMLTQLEQTEDVYPALDRLFSCAPAPTAIMAANYPLAIPLFNYLDAHNILCPQDVSVIVFNEFDWAPLHTPPLTTIDQNGAAVASQAVRMLLDQITSSATAAKSAPSNKTAVLPGKVTTLPCYLKVRASTCGIGRGPFGEKAENADVLTLTAGEEELLRNKNYTAAISFHYSGKAWMELHQKGIRDVFDNLGISLIAITDAHFNPELQNKQLASLSLLEPDVIIAVPTDNEKTADAFLRIVNSQARLVLVTNVPTGLTPKDYVSCISVNEHSHGQNMGRSLGEYMRRHSLKNVGVLRHGANFYATRQRDAAAIQVLNEEYPELNLCQIAEFDSESEVYQKTCELVKHHPEIEGLYISWEGPAAEAMSALSQLSRTDIAIVTGDLDYDTALNMARGGMIKAISAQCPYEQGQAIALAAANALLHKKVPSFIGIEPMTVTAENLLKSWKVVFKEEAPGEIREAIRQNPYCVR